MTTPNKVFGLDPLAIEIAMKDFDLTDPFEAAMTLHVLEVLYDHQQAGGEGMTEKEIEVEVFKRMGLDEHGNMLQ